MTYRITVGDNAWFVRDTIENLRDLWDVLKRYNVKFREEKMDDYMGRVVDAETFLRHSGCRS